ncbi:(2,3-dihydroxybenzoyl)adenylate synthase [Vibrio vulnificus]|uniref:(2,3-dihydroxybenzoyl)adenylate synthase n=1 Tax=Vibrio vulnificus TaxID=672 RepID=UPI00307DB263
MNSVQSDFTPWPEQMANDYRRLGLWQDKTLYQYLKQSIIRYPTNIAIVCSQQSITYAELERKIHAAANGFRSLGLAEGDNVILQMTNIAEFYVSYFALIHQGIRPILALPAHRHAEISYFCQHAQAKAYLIDGQTRGFDYQTLAEQLIKEHPCLRHVIVRAKHSELLQSHFISFDDFRDERELAPVSNASQVAFFQLSGGTTGTPKLIPRTHNDYAYSVVGSNAICGFNEYTRYLCALPAAHNFPLSSPGSLGVFFAGGTVILTQDPTPKAAFPLIERHKVTVSALVPPLALLWMDAAPHARYNLSSLQLIQVGGAKLSQSAAKALPKALNCQLQQVFGMAEGLVNYTRLDDPLEVIIETQGRPISAHDQVKVVNEAGEEVACGEEGFLLTQGPYTIRGYYRAPEHNQRSFTHNGFYRTGDIVKITEQGNIIVTGRDKDQINRGGEKIAAEEVENHLLGHSAIHDVALIAIPDRLLGERSCAVVVTNHHLNTTGTELKRYLRSKGLADYKIPDVIQFADTLPKTSVGKIDKKRLRESYAQLGLSTE